MPEIKGYRPLSDAEIDLINDIKTQGEKMGVAIEASGAIPGVDQRWLAIARTNIQQGIMAWVRAITKPDGF
jgi:hypothetical protein